VAAPSGAGYAVASMRKQPLAVWVLLFTLSSGLLGATSIINFGLPLAWGLSVVAACGLLLRLAFGDYKRRWLRFLFGPRVPGEEG
jgi:hypothetical protein